MDADLVPPKGFDDHFLDWLDRMSRHLFVSFASTGCVPDEELNRLERQTGILIPADLRLFYGRYDPWHVLSRWHGWELVQDRFRTAGVIGTILPIDHRSYSSRGDDTIAAVVDKGGYLIVCRNRQAGRPRTFPDLRSYFMEAVHDEIASSHG